MGPGFFYGIFFFCTCLAPQFYTLQQAGAMGGDGGGEECFKGSCKNKFRHAVGGSTKLPDPDIASLQAWATKVFDNPDMQAQADAATIESPASLTQARAIDIIYQEAL